MMMLETATPPPLAGGGLNGADRARSSGGPQCATPALRHGGRAPGGTTSGPVLDLTHRIDRGRPVRGHGHVGCLPARWGRNTGRPALERLVGSLTRPHLDWWHLDPLEDSHPDVAASLAVPSDAGGAGRGVGDPHHASAPDGEYADQARRGDGAATPGRGLLSHRVDRGGCRARDVSALTHRPQVPDITRRIAHLGTSDHLRLRRAVGRRRRPRTHLGYRGVLGSRLTLAGARSRGCGWTRLGWWSE